MLRYRWRNMEFRQHIKDQLVIIACMKRRCIDSLEFTLILRVTIFSGAIKVRKLGRRKEKPLFDSQMDRESPA